MKGRIRKRVLLVPLFLLLAACSGGGGSTATGGGGNGSSPPPPALPPAQPPGDPEPLDLTGSWLGAFDDTDKTRIRTMQLEIDGHLITEISFEDGPSDLTGSIDVATEVDRAFRFELNNNQGLLNRGVLIVDRNGDHLLYVDRNKGIAVLQRGASELPAFERQDIHATWQGDAVSLTPELSLHDRREFSIVCAVESADFSQCTLADGRVTPDVQMDERGGPAWIGHIAGGGEHSVARAYMSANGQFTGWWACDDYRDDFGGAGKFPESCTFAVLNRQ